MIQSARSRIPLNGTWQVEGTNDDRPPETWRHNVPVPGLVDLADPGYDATDFKYHWYRTTFEPTTKAGLAFLVIEQAMFGTDVWLNRTHLGGDIACYTSQEYDMRPALRMDATNELLVRVGQRAGLPPRSAVGNDQERTRWIPGIWGDVYLLFTGNPRIKLVQVLPDIKSELVRVRIWIENRSAKAERVKGRIGVRETGRGQSVGESESFLVEVPPHALTMVEKPVSIRNLHLWSPDDPFLYELETCIMNRETISDFVHTRFGMREFTIVGSDFFLNGKKIFLRGGNIAFHRFLSDPDRSTLPWEPGWIKKLLIDVPKAHNFNFFRNHIGHMYNRWYDMADEYGMLLQDEWMFWTVSGTKEQIGIEFTRWLQDNWNHPSIVIWDALNECSDEVVQKEIVPEMKKLDPTRPWESVDVVEDHPYIYSLGPVMNDRTFGHTRSLVEIERSSTPSVVNEFCWWWLDKENHAAPLTKDVIERWLGPVWSTADLVAHQSFLIQELVEFFRRMGVDAIQPFVYLSNNNGPTGHWFEGDVRELNPKPVLAALKNAFSPFGISIDLWDRHFIPGEQRNVRVHIFNDCPDPREGMVRFGIVGSKENWYCEERLSVAAKPSSTTILEFNVTIPGTPQSFEFRAELFEHDKFVASSAKIGHIVAPAIPVSKGNSPRVALFHAASELGGFLTSHGCTVTRLNSGEDADCILVNEQEVRTSAYADLLDRLTGFLGEGKPIILIEPERGVEVSARVRIASGVELKIVRRQDSDRGGYDSYIFPEDLSHQLWAGLNAEHFRMFNGGYGGEVVSQHDVTTNAEHAVLARCGLKLNVPAVFEIPVGNSRIIVSRLQLRRRLVDDKNDGSPFGRRVDPVMQKYFYNLVLYAWRGKENV